MTHETGDSIEGILAAARREGRRFLPETAAAPIVAGLGIRLPHHARVGGEGELGGVDLAGFHGDSLVLKVTSERIQHKSDVGGVRVVNKTVDAIADAMGEMRRGVPADALEGFSLHEYVSHDASPGGELLLGLRYSQDFGPIVTLGAGGVHAEFLARRAGLAPVVISPGFGWGSMVGTPLFDLIATPQRGRPPRITPEALGSLLDRWCAFAARHCPADVAEFEVNPLVLVDGEPVALDALLRIGEPVGGKMLPRPLDKLDRLLRPESVAVVGVSRKANPGHVIVDNLLRDGFARERIFIVKPGAEEFEGCRCVSEIPSLPEPVDLLVLSIDAAQVPGAVEQVVDSRKAESMIVIPGGLGESSGSASLAEQVRRSLDESRATDWGGPVVNGANCLGVRSVPGRYDTMFIPQHKLPPRTAEPAPVAVISQSGALIVARASKLGWLNPRYMISLGNQIDLTFGDYLEHLAADAEVEIFACYVEGFAVGDGRRWLAAARSITESGRTVILYRAGRTEAGARASASHTASVAGDYAVTRELARAAGVVIAESLEEFDELIGLFACLRGKPVRGWRLGAISNAGFECVALADHCGRFRLEPPGDATTESISKILRECRLDKIVDVHNPIDVNPTMGDAAFAETARAVLADDGVDVGVIGCVPLTGALDTLPGEKSFPDDSVVRRLVRLKEDTDKPWIAVVDAGALYDPMAAALQAEGIPVFRSADRAMRVFELFCAARLAAP